MHLSLFQKRTCVVPTWRGWVVLLLLAAALSVFLVRNAYGFLAVQDPRPGGFLVLEGWEPDYVLTEALAELERHSYDGIIVAGDPIGKGAPLSEYSDYAQLTVAILEKMGADPRRLHVAVAGPVARDRTYSMSVTLHAWLIAHGHPEANINLMTLGAHARRSRLLFEKAIGRKVGVIAIADRDFVPSHWWRSSAGFRGVTSELIAYIYARFLFTALTP